MLKVNTFIINSVSEATCIANGDKTFYVVGSESGIKTGDTIHFNLVSSDANLKHEVSDKLYVVSYIDPVCDEIHVLSIRPYMNWSTYVDVVLISAHKNNSMVRVQFYGRDNIENSLVYSYHDFMLYLQDKNGGDIQRDIRDIVNISIM